MTATQQRLPGIPAVLPFAIRYRPIVTVTPRCCNCGTRYSFAWRDYNSLPVCGDCAGLCFEDVWDEEATP